MGVLSLVFACHSGSTAPNALEGSLSELIDLGYDHAAVEWTAQDVAIRFVRVRTAGEDTILKVGASLEGMPLTPGIKLNLSDVVSGGKQRGVVSRDVLNDTPRIFPGILRGELQLDQVPMDHSSVGGQLHVTFLDGTTFASGRTVFGSFGAKIP